MSGFCWKGVELLVQLVGNKSVCFTTAIASIVVDYNSHSGEGRVNVHLAFTSHWQP